MTVSYPDPGHHVAALFSRDAFDLKGNVLDADDLATRLTIEEKEIYRRGRYCRARRLWRRYSILIAEECSLRLRFQERMKRGSRRSRHLDGRSP